MAEQEGAIDVKGLKQEHIPTVKSGEGHVVSFDIAGLPDEIYVNDTVSLVVFAECSSGCSLLGDAVTLTALPSGEQIASTTLVTEEDGLACTDGMLITVPGEPGDYQYKIHYEPAPLPLPDDGGPAFPNPHAARDLLLVLTVKEHHVALSTWGLTTPAFVGEDLEVCVGASCSDGCALTGSTVQVFDSAGELKAEGTLQDPVEPRPKLYWAKLTAKVPEEAKLHRWEARFTCAEAIEMPHEATPHKFSFVARVRPEREFSITVIDAKTDKPLRSARVEIKPEGGKAQFASTNGEGKATIGCAKGAYDLKVTSASRKNYTEKVDLTAGDVEVEVRMQPTTSKDDAIPMTYVKGAPQPAAPEKAPEQEKPAETEKPAAPEQPAEAAQAAEPAAAAPASAEVPEAEKAAAPEKPAE